MFELIPSWTWVIIWNARLTREVMYDLNFNEVDGAIIDQTWDKENQLRDD